MTHIGTDLLTHPRWRAEDLGQPMPDSIHAASACLPLWEHNVRYEEGDPDVVNRLQAAYPRFCLNPLVRTLCQRTFGADGLGLIFPTRRVAERAAAYVVHRGGRTADLVPLPGQQVVGVRTGADDFGRLKEYWQHTGEFLSSRSAEQILAGQRVTFSESPARIAVRQRLAEFGGCNPEDIFLYPCGMSAIAAVWRAVQKIRPGFPSVQFGFPYVDTLKIQQRFGAGQHLFFSRGDANDLNQLRATLQQTPVSGLFCETPTNPLLTSPDLRALNELAREAKFLLVVDDTLAACINDNVLPLCDVAVTSLTKFFSGYGNVLAGNARINPQGHMAGPLRTALFENFEELLADCDVEVLESNSRDVVSRVSLINQNAGILADRIAAHPAVARVHYPAPNAPSGVSARGRGGLMSVVLKNPDQTTPQVYDRLKVCKGPNLGTNFTLCCPYALLAHYKELDEVEKSGVSRWLLRVSIGTEPVEELWSRFKDALDSVIPGN